MRRNLRKWTIVQQLKTIGRVSIVRPIHLIAVSVGVFLAITLFLVGHHGGIDNSLVGY